MNESARWLSNRGPELLFAACLAAAATILVVAGSGLVFFYDEWEVVLFRNSLGWDSLFSPHNGQLFVVPVLIYKAVLSAFGMGTQMPLRLLAVGFATACSVLLFVYARRRTSPWMALVLTLPVLCLGAGWEALLLPLSMNFLIGLGAGLGMLLVLERNDGRGDLAATGLLILSISAGSIGLAFAAGAAVDLLLRRDIRRIWIVVAPLAGFGLWGIIYGGEVGQQVPAVDLAAIPDNLLRSLSAVTVALSGFSVDRRPGYWLSVVMPDGFTHQPGRIMAYLVMFLVAARVVAARWAPIGRTALIVGAVLIAFWVLTGLTNGGGREPEASRYMYPGAVLFVAFTAAMIEGIRLPKWAPLLLLPLVIYSLSISTVKLRDGRDMLTAQTELTRSAIGALEHGGGQSKPDLSLAPVLADTDYFHFLDSGPYFRARDQYRGSVGYSKNELEDAYGEPKAVADRVLRLIERGR